MKMLIGGKHCDSSDKKTIDVINPATNELIDTVPAATKEDIDRALSIAVAAQKEWAKTPLYKRAEIMRKFIEIVDDNIPELSKTLSCEMGKAISEAKNDFACIGALFNGFIEAADMMLTDTMPLGVQQGREHDMEINIREPLGVIVCIIPFNAPTVMFGHKVAPSLIAGNSVVIKPASDDPLTVLMLSDMLEKAGLPKGVVQVLTGSGSVIGGVLSGDKRVSKITFTGSTEVGTEIYINAAKNLTHVSLELGGNAPLIVMEDGDVELAVREAIAFRAAYLTGQVCMAAKRFIVHKSIKKEFVSKLIEGLKKLKVGDISDESTQVGSLISEKAARLVEQQVNLTVEQGAVLLLGGKRNGAYYMPTVLDNVTADMDVAHDMEIFGPVFPIISFETEEEAVAISNATIYGLGAGIITENYRTAIRLAMQLESGSVIINGQSCYRSYLMPFGGYKKSGIGREGLTSTLQEVTQQKSIVLKGII